jgi:DNA-binding winged helix-turn-helix (wHTH) protein
MAPAGWERRVQFVFGECVLDTDRRELSRRSESVAVGPQVFDLLIHLIENRGRVVSKDELFDVIWHGRTVSESTLTSHVNFARRAIGDTGEEQRLIRRAAGGLKFNRFHTTALCSPSRQALLTGRNHHSAGMGGITEIATGAPGYNSVLPNTISPLARTLKLNGYSTAQFGKCHEVPVWETSPVGPFDAWPTGGGGFEYFYGFIGGEANQWYPTIYEGTTPVEPKKTPGKGEKDDRLARRHT